MRDCEGNCIDPLVNGNLPQFKKPQHIGHKWNPCPFSTQATNLRVRHLLANSVYEYSAGTYDLMAIQTDRNESNFGQFIIPDSQIDTVLSNVLGYSRVDHHTDTGVGYHRRANYSGDVFMATESRGTSWGFECMYNDCPYYLSTGKRYFYA